MKIMPSFVPDGCDYLTYGKEYNVDWINPEDENSCIINDDEGDRIIIIIKSSNHINGHHWIIVDEEES